MEGKVISVSRNATHSFSKECVREIFIAAGLGVQGDAHAGVTVRHRYMVRKDPTAPNLCQVHLMAVERLSELKDEGFELEPGEMGENITTSGLDLAELPLGTWLHLGTTAIVQVTGLRTPCAQMDGHWPGLMRACLGRDDAGNVVRKAGIMGVAMFSGTVRSGDAIEVELPQPPWFKLPPV